MYQRKIKTTAKMATLCEHIEERHYSQGLCQACYLAKYYVEKRIVRKKNKRLSKVQEKNEKGDSFIDQESESLENEQQEEKYDQEEESEQEQSPANRRYKKSKR